MSRQKQIIDFSHIWRSHLRKVEGYQPERESLHDAHQFILLDGNENAFGTVGGGGAFNKFPDSRQLKLRQKIAELHQVKASQVFTGFGTDAIIDLIIRLCCEPGHDRVITMPPTCGKYAALAEIHGVDVQEVPLNGAYQMNTRKVLEAADHKSKLLFICSPNDPTGNSMRALDILEIAEHFPGLVLVDENYIEFAKAKSVVEHVALFPRLIVLRGLTHGHGLAAQRFAYAIMHETVVQMLDRIKLPYNVDQHTQDIALQTLQDEAGLAQTVQAIVQERERVGQALAALPCVKRVYPSEANFLLVYTIDAEQIYHYLYTKKILVSNRSHLHLCDDCLRITIGQPEDNDKLIAVLENMPKGFADDKSLMNTIFDALRKPALVKSLFKIFWR